MLQKIENLITRLIDENDDPNTLDAEDIAYLEQIKSVADLLNFTDDGSEKMISLAADAASALGQSSYWIARNIDSGSADTHDFSHSGLGISGLANYDEPVIIPSTAAIKRMEKIELEMETCRRCGASDLIDGAMFTTMAGSGYCDDCC